jgi:tetratricopeptide (TPR) repeat protein
MALDREDVALALRWQVKQALLNLHDPITLARHPLAHWLPPARLAAAHDDPGRALQSALQDALEYIRPGDRSEDRSGAWRAYHALRVRFVEGLAAHEAARQLAVSERELRRAQQAGLHRVADYLRELIRPQYQLLGPEPIPRLSGLVGRDAVLARYRRQLEQEHFAAIVGLPGVGKTSLGAELATAWSPRGPVLWLSVREGRNDYLEALIETLAMSLAAVGHDEYWHFLRATAAHATALPAGAKLRYLINLLGEINCLICLDNLQLVNRKPALVAFCGDLLQNARAGRLTLLVMGREQPAFAAGDPAAPLPGLDEAGARQLLQGAGLPPLPEADFAELYRLTQGVPLFLRWFAAGVRGQTGDGRQQISLAFIHKMMHEPEIESFLLREVEKALSPDERRLLAWMAVVRTPLDFTTASILDCLRAAGVEDAVTALAALAGRQVVMRLAGGETLLHPLIREYAYRRLQQSPEECARLHRQVAVYYEQSTSDFLEAAYHHYEAGAYAAGARLLHARAHELVDAGQAEGALALLNRLNAQQLGDPELWQSACCTRGQLHEVLGDYPAALVCYQEALRLGGSPERLAEVYRRLGRVQVQQAHYRPALASFEQGLACLSGQRQAVERARLCYNAAMAHQWLGDYPAALELGRQSLAILEQHDLRLETGDACRTLGQIYLRQGDYTQALASCRRALDLYQGLGHTAGIAAVQQVLGELMVRQGDHQRALAYFREGRDLYRRIRESAGVLACLNGLNTVYLLRGEYQRALRGYRRLLWQMERNGDVRGVAITLSNLGIIHKRRGNYPRAIHYYRQSLALCERIGYKSGMVAACINLGYADYCQGRWPEAIDCCQTGLTIGQELGGVYELVSLHTLLGQIHYEQGDHAASLGDLARAMQLQQENADRGFLLDTYLIQAALALEHGELSKAREHVAFVLSIAAQSHMQKELGEAGCLMGEICAAAGQPEQAGDYFRRSVELLVAILAPFELGRARRVFGAFLWRRGETDAAWKQLREAEAIFRRIGARHELERALAVLRQLPDQARTGPVA